MRPVLPCELRARCSALLMCRNTNRDRADRCQAPSTALDTLTTHLSLQRTGSRAGRQGVAQRGEEQEGGEGWTQTHWLQVQASRSGCVQPCW